MYAAERPGLYGATAGVSIPESETATTLHVLVVVGMICSEPAVAWACSDGKGNVEEAATRLDVNDGKVFGFLLSLFDVSSSLKALDEG